MSTQYIPQSEIAPNMTGRDVRSVTENAAFEGMQDWQLAAAVACATGVSIPLDYANKELRRLRHSDTIEATVSDFKRALDTTRSGRRTTLTYKLMTGRAV